jgi:hypothetical protein
MLATVAIFGCGSDSPSGPDRRTQTQSGFLDDPTRCTCNNGTSTGLQVYGFETTKSGTIEATATFQPADARLVVRLLDSSFNTVYVVSTLSGTSARFTYEGAPGKYNVQVFLASDGPRQATFNLTLQYP